MRISGIKSASPWEQILDFLDMRFSSIEIVFDRFFVLDRCFVFALNIALHTR
jgi:hypothetical protein